MIKEKMKKGSALIVALALLLSVLILPQVGAAVGVENERTDCAIEINVTGSGFKELSGADENVEALPITVNLYKVADISMEGKYFAAANFETVDFSGLSSETTADDWAKLAELAKAEIEADEMAVTATGNTEDGSVTITGLAAGLYLVDAQQVLSDYYQYDFTPYLISLPNNYYYTDGDDTWVYELTGDKAVGLKPEKSDRFGDLVINKELDVYNETLGGANFVFQIEATKTDIDTEEVTVVYSDVVSMTFDGYGFDSIKIEHIPAGSEVIVTEVYSGSSYELTSDASQMVTIVAEDAVETNFSNTFNEKLNGGTGLVNRFSYNSESGEWTHSASVDSTP